MREVETKQKGGLVKGWLWRINMRSFRFLGSRNISEIIAVFCHCRERLLGGNFGTGESAKSLCKPPRKDILRGRSCGCPGPKKRPVNASKHCKFKRYWARTSMTRDAHGHDPGRVPKTWVTDELWVAFCSSYHSAGHSFQQDPCHTHL